MDSYANSNKYPIRDTNKYVNSDVYPVGYAHKHINSDVYPIGNTYTYTHTRYNCHDRSHMVPQ
jgi:hypothetical protein